MKKIYLIILAACFITAGCIIMRHSTSVPHKMAYMGDQDAIGSDEDADARYNYELQMLRDPATGRIPANIVAGEMAFAANLPNDAFLAGARTTAALDWQARGPWNLGGRTRAFAIDVTNPNCFIAGSCSGSMYRSTDGGRTWHTTTLSNQYKTVSCVAQDTRPGHQNVWYYATGEAYGASASGGGAYYNGSGVYKSVDSGETWSVLPSTAPASVAAFTIWSQIAWNIATNPADTAHDVVYVASIGGVHKSLDGGTTWTLALGNGNSYFTDVVVTPKGVVYATLSSDGAGPGIYRSADGITFTNITPDSFPRTFNRLKIGVSPSYENQVYILGNTPNYGMPDTNYLGSVEWNSLWRYTYKAGNGARDSNGHWENRSANLPMTGGPFDKFTCQGSYDLVVKVKPNDTNVVFIGGTNLYRSTSAFADKTHSSYLGGYREGATLPVVNMFLNHHPDQHELVFLPNDPNKMISTNDGGIFYTNDNTVPSVLWSSLNNGYLTSMFYSCAIDHASTSNIVIGGAQDNGSWFTNSTDLHTPWVSPRGGDGSYCAIADNSSAYYLSIQNGRMMRAKLDYAGRVDSFARIDPIGGHGYQFINPYVIDPNNNDLMYLAGGKSLWRNNNLSGIPYASNWDSIATNWVRFPDSNAASGTITALAISKNPANRLYFGCSSYRVFRVDSANIGTHSFRNITSTVTGNAFPGGGNVSCIAVDPNNADNVMVVFSNYNVNSLWYSSNGGTTWTKVGGNLEQNKVSGSGNGPSCRWASIIPVKDGTVYLVGTSIGLFATTQLRDTSTTWVQQGTNTIGSSVVDMIDYRSTDGLVVIATHSSGMYSTHITQVANVNGVAPVTVENKGYDLLTYPNPFADYTNIRFTLKERGDVIINVFDQTGRLVKTIAEGQMDAGEQHFIFRPDNLPAGVYYCSIKAGTGSEVSKMVIVH